MDAINVINQNKILVDVLYRGSVNLIGIVIGDALVYSNPTVEIQCYTCGLSFKTTEYDEISLEDEEFELLITYEDGEFSILLKSHNFGELGYIERVI